MISQETYARDRLTIFADEHDIAVEHLASPSRRAPLPYLRRKFAREMRGRGVTSTVLGRVLNRDPGTIRAGWL